MRKHRVGVGLGDRVGGVASFGGLTEVSGRVTAALLQTADILVTVELRLSVHLEFIDGKKFSCVPLDLEPFSLSVLVAVG
jgi:hypothetical protein